MDTNVSQTIDEVCIWIKNELKNTSALSNGSILPEMISALAELVAANPRYLL